MRKLVPLSPRQRDVLLLLEKGKASGMIPTMREMADDMGGIRHAAVSAHIRALERKGYVRRRNHGARAIEILHPINKPGLPLLTLEDLHRRKP